jgi:molybdopterin converting factor small subunit
MAAHIRIHLMTSRGMQRADLDLDVGKGIKLKKVLGRLDKNGIVEKGFFRSVLRGRQGITVVLNGERLDLEDNKKREITDGDELAILSPLTGG